MADCGSDNIGTCTMQSLFLTQNCLEKFIDNVYSVDELRDARGSVAEKKQSFCSSDESDTTEDSVSNVGSNSTESSDSAICSLDSGPEESDSFKEKCGDRYDCSESSGRWVYINPWAYCIRIFVFSLKSVPKFGFTFAHSFFMIIRYHHAKCRVSSVTNLRDGFNIFPYIGSITSTTRAVNPVYFEYHSNIWWLILTVKYYNWINEEFILKKPLPSVVV